MNIKTKKTICRQCLLCGVIFKHQQSQNKHCLRVHKQKSERGVTWQFVTVTTTVSKGEAK